ncbi:MAG TPA: S8 family serine peptidase, partial [Flavisolibacter sp.]|nr:S8 family serine peptidase [Flavisolibacter sp.]
FPSLFEHATDGYTKTFNGTSSASAIITGVAIALQGIAEANLHSRLNPSQIRAFLSNETYGTASANGRATDKIGVMPDLKKIIRDLLKLHPAEKSKAHSN